MHHQNVTSVQKLQDGAECLADIRFPLLDLAQVRTVHLRLIGKALLR
jgi:hypothetical protein